MLPLSRQASLSSLLNLTPLSSALNQITQSLSYRQYDNIPYQHTITPTQGLRKITAKSISWSFNYTEFYQTEVQVIKLLEWQISVVVAFNF